MNSSILQSYRPSVFTHKDKIQYNENELKIKIHTSGIRLYSTLNLSSLQLFDEFMNMFIMISW